MGARHAIHRRRRVHVPRRQARGPVDRALRVPRQRRGCPGASPGRRRFQGWRVEDHRQPRPAHRQGSPQDLPAGARPHARRPRRQERARRRMADPRARVPRVRGDPHRRRPQG